MVGQNGIINHAQEARKNYDKEAVREKVTILLMEHITTRDEKQETLDDFLNRKKEEGEIDDAINNGDGTHTIITDGYEIIVDDETLEIIKVEQESWFKRITRGKARFVYSIDSEYVADVDVGIEIDESVRQYTTQYKIGDEEGAQWVNYTLGETFKVKVNGTIYGRIVNQETGEVGYEFKSEIKGIDTTPPQEAMITFNTTVVNAGETIQATVELKDLESGIDLSNCKYIINTSSTKLGENATQWDTANLVTENPLNFNITQSTGVTCYVHVLSVDKAGNKIETVSSSIRFRVSSGLWSTSKLAWNDSNTANFWNLTNGQWGNQLSVGANQKGASCYARSKQSYDLTTCSTITFSADNIFSYDSASNPSYIHFGVASTGNATNFVVKTSKSFSTGTRSETWTIDVSNLEGQYYFMIQVTAAGTTSVGFNPYGARLTWLQ